MKPPNVKCLKCDKKVYVPRYRIETFKYCSRKCLGLDCRMRIIQNCKICKKEFEHISSRCNKAKYCSRRCYYDSQKMKGKKQYTCHHCEKIFLGHAAHTRKYCSKKCVGKSRKETFKPSYTTVRKAMLSRDMIKACEKCGYNEYPQILGVHHIDENRHNNSKENLQVLCPICHSLAHMKHISH